VVLQEPWTLSFISVDVPMEITAISVRDKRLVCETDVHRTTIALLTSLVVSRQDLACEMRIADTHTRIPGAVTLERFVVTAMEQDQMHIECTLTLVAGELPRRAWCLPWLRKGVLR
jgi:hypothetical protein